MNNKSLTLSLLSAVLAVLFVSSYVTSLEDQAKKKFGSEVLVLVATQDIKEMETINETMLNLRVVPKSFLEPAAISYENVEAKEEHMKEAKRIVGSIAVVPIKKGEQIAFNKITEPSIRTGLAPQISPGKRAVSVGISEVSGVGKLIKPGDRIDVIAIVGVGDRKESKVARTILQDVVVLAVGKYVANNAPRTIENDPYGGKQKVKSLAEYDGFSTLTLEVDPQQAQLIALVNSLSDNQIHVALRNNDDSDRPVMNATTFNDVSGVDTARANSRQPSGGYR